MGVSYQRDPDNDKLAPARGIVFASFFGLCCWSLLAGVVLFFLLNGWSLG